MEATILVWYLVTAYYKSGVDYSPPLATVEDCRRMKEFVERERYGGLKSQCIQVRVPK